MEDCGSGTPNLKVVYFKPPCVCKSHIEGRKQKIQEFLTNLYDDMVRTSFNF